jgi:putative peptidoglycan lipid II flippase
MPNKGESTIGRKLGTLFAGGLISKGLGLGREVALAYAFGTSYVADAFRVALTALTLPTHFLTGEALFAAFIPAYRRLPERDRPSLVRSAFTGLIGSTVFLAVAVVVAAPLVVSLMAPGFDPRAAELCAQLIRVGSVGAVLYALSALLVNVQIAHGDYLLHAARPSIQNLCILASIVAAASWNAPVLLTLGFVAAYMVMTGWALREVGRSRLPVRDALRPTIRWRRDVLADFGRSVGQLSLLVMLTQASIVVDRIVASLTGEGGVAAIDYSFFVTDSLRLLLAVPVATLALGQLGGRAWTDVSESLRRSFAPLLVVSIAISAYLFGLAEEIVTLLYRRGEFQETATRLTTASLRGFAVGAWAGTAGYILQRVFNAAMRNREVVRAGAWGLGVNVTLDLLLYGPLGVLGVALATSASVMVFLGVLLAGSGFGWQLVSRVWLSIVALGAWAITLQAPLGEGIVRLALSGISLLGCFMIPFALSRPLRDDMLWLVRRLKSR